MLIIFLTEQYYIICKEKVQDFHAYSPFNFKSKQLKHLQQLYAMSYSRSPSLRQTIMEIMDSLSQSSRNTKEAGRTTNKH